MTSNATVAVACKLPTGLKLELPGQKPIQLLGSRIPRDENGNLLSDRRLPGGFGVTFGVPKDFWEEWKAKHKGFAPLEKSFIFAFEKEADTNALAKEMEDEKTGLEGANPDALPSKLETMDDKTPQ